MTPESLVQLVGSGNRATVEEEWMRLMESPELSPRRLADYHVILGELCRRGDNSQAEELAWAGIEAVRERLSPQEALTVAEAFLLAVGESDELRAQVAELYRACHGRRKGFDALLSEAGLEGGRPVRRALRTLDVCLNISVGDYLAGNDGEGAARVERIDPVDWRITITSEKGTETLGAVHLADRYRPASSDEFRVMRHFAPEVLVERLSRDPASVVIEICREHGDLLNSDTLEEILVPELIPEEDWKKWWTRARAALKRCPNIRIEGRSPYQIRFIETPVTLEDELFAAFEAAVDPPARFASIEKYLKSCKARGQPPSESVLERCASRLAERARQSTAKDTVQAGLCWVISLWLARTIGRNDAPPEALAFLREATSLKDIFDAIENETLLSGACAWLAEARPDDWTEHLSDLLPRFSTAGCDLAARRLIEAGRGGADLEPVVDRIISSPIDHFEALLWLWDGPSAGDQIPSPPLPTIFSRILWALEECQRDDRIPKEATRKLVARARSLLSARKYERFEKCLANMDSGLAGALRTRLRRFDLLGRALRADLLNRLDRRFKPARSEDAADPWTRDDVLYVTEAGLIRKQQEIDHLVNVKMKENAEAIGRAAEHGDLSENSEYKFALEERDLLRARLAQMNAEVAAARVIGPADVPTDHVGIGTKVIFERETDGERYEMSMVGPWEADASKGLFNYKAPLAQRVLGKRVGDVIEFDHTGAVGLYRIVSLENALAASSTT